MVERAKSSFILDIGIRHGGQYITRDSDQTLRIGADWDRDELPVLLKNFEDRNANLAACALDAQCTDKVGLPFVSSSFDGVEIYFPHNTLLKSLYERESSLWQELHRVVKPQGAVSVYIDLFINVGLQYNFNTGWEDAPTWIFRPRKKICDAAGQSGFLVTSTKMSPNAVRAIGTSNAFSIYTEDYNNWLRKVGVFQIVAQKL